MVNDEKVIETPNWDWTTILQFMLSLYVAADVSATVSYCVGRMVVGPGQLKAEKHDNQSTSRFKHARWSSRK